MHHSHQTSLLRSYLILLQYAYDMLLIIIDKFNGTGILKY